MLVPESLETGGPGIVSPCYGARILRERSNLPPEEFPLSERESSSRGAADPDTDCRENLTARLRPAC